ncbi:hypothetical protein EDC96DRAFT_545323 [Choanephora cucurbitarum]|nr:hypothetical protein EDC96DRAFT_545323 [Choanephora cucurbitarum]
MSRTQVRKHVYVKPTIKVVKNLSCHGLQASFQGPGNPGGPGDSGCPILAGLNQSAIASTKEDVSGGAYERGSLSYQVGCLWLISKVLTFLSDTLWLYAHIIHIYPHTVISHWFGQSIRLTNILDLLPLSRRRVLTSEITTCLHPPPRKQLPDPSISFSPARIKWFMEVIGDMSITSDDVDTYSRWLFETQARPAAVTQEGLEQDFYRIAFHQLSLLFQPRIVRNSSSSPPNSNYTTTNTTTHNINLSDDKSHLLPPKTSGSFHIAMLPVSAHGCIVPITFNPPTSTSTPTSNTNAMTRVSTAIPIQRHIGLCKKSLHVFAMVGRTLEMSTDTRAVLLQEKVEGMFVSGPNVRSRLSNEFAHYAWHPIIYPIPHPLQLLSSNFTLAMLGISSLVDTFNSTSNSSNQQEKSEKDSIDRINIVPQDVQEPKKTC